jgi:hypothetical protein
MLVFAAIGGFVMAIVTVVAETSNQTLAVGVAFPGIICHLLITGGHGGTRAEEIAGYCVAVAINAFIGAAVFLLAYAVFRSLDRRRVG